MGRIVLARHSTSLKESFIHGKAQRSFLPNAEFEVHRGSISDIQWVTRPLCKAQEREGRRPSVALGVINEGLRGSRGWLHTPLGKLGGLLIMLA